MCYSPQNPWFVLFSSKNNLNIIKAINIYQEAKVYKMKKVCYQIIWRKN